MAGSHQLNSSGCLGPHLRRPPKAALFEGRNQPAAPDRWGSRRRKCSSAMAMVVKSQARKRQGRHPRKVLKDKGERNPRTGPEPPYSTHIIGRSPDVRPGDRACLSVENRHKKCAPSGHLERLGDPWFSQP